MANEKENTANANKFNEVNNSQTHNVSYFDDFLKDIANHLAKECIITRYLQRFAYGTDASFYRLIPKLVLIIDTPDQICQVLGLADKYRIAITFRAAGTSVSGQAITDSVLVMLSSQWQGIEIREQGRQVLLQPGVIGAHANKALAQYSRKIGPDPASINSCKVGGIAANNSSGMCCGVKDNSYHTLADINLTFANGSQLNTADKSSRDNFVNQNPALVNGILALAEQVNADNQLVEKIKHKYRLKNTTGYGLNALIDFTDPIDIISHLLIGSEGTLAFINDITYNTVEILPHKSAGIFVFDDMKLTCALINEIANVGVDAVEIMDARSLTSVESQLAEIINIALICDVEAEINSQGSSINPNSVALLIEFTADNENSLNKKKNQLETLLNSAADALKTSTAFSSKPSDIERLWKIRKGMFPAVGAMRKLGTTVVIEDVAFPLANLADGIDELQQLFDRFGYNEAIIFGHALDGNLHFVFTQTFETPEQIDRYDEFMTAVTQLVAVDYQGSLKAEHGTGRNMAPFVETEWGTPLYKVMQELKLLFDPKGILNPGVIINDDKMAHLKHLKTMTAADDIIDACIECGFCESVCPSKDFTITPRQRIALWRQKAYLTHQMNISPESRELKSQLLELEQDYEFFGIDSCAATGLCGQQCPVGIDTGMFIKSLRQKRIKLNSELSSVMRIKLNSAGLAAAHFSTASKLTKLGLNAVAGFQHLLGSKVTKTTFKALSKATQNHIPLWFESWPNAERNTPAEVAQTNKAILSDAEVNNVDLAKVVYVPSCANRIFGADLNAVDQRSLPVVVQSLCTKAGIELITPKQSDELCCGMPWQSKGLADIAQTKNTQYVEAIIVASEQGKWPIISDASPCALTIKQTDTLDNLQTFDVTEFVVKHVIDKLTIKPTNKTYMLHNTCSSEKMDQGKYLKHIAKLCSDNIVEPEHITCCGFAGDKGFYLPELNKSALAPLKAQVPLGCSGGLSNSRTCEIGLSEHSGVSYQSVLYLLDQCSS